MSSGRTGSGEHAADTPPTWVAVHDAADDGGQDGYFDPATGLFVMTRGYLLRRGNCCSTGCRHCPYG